MSHWPPRNEDNNDNIGDGSEDQIFGPGHFYLGPSNLDPYESTDDSTEMVSISPMGSESSVIKATPKEAPSQDKMDAYLALGAVRLSRKPDHEGEDSWYMVGPKLLLHPHKDIEYGEQRGWIKSELLQHGTHPDRALLRIYALPEDVNRGSRGSIKHLRKVLKLLADFIDVCPETWQGNYDPLSSVRTYKHPDSSEEQSLFYIFNTLASPRTTRVAAGNVLYNNQSMHDIFEDDILGLKTSLYPYQKRSVAVMLQKEVNPSKTLDARKPQFTDLNGTTFYFDVHDSVLLRHPHLYDECRGGILAETMGYGKTLICIALMLATRGHYCDTPEGRIDTLPETCNERTPTLFELTAKRMRQAAIPWKSYFATRKLGGDHYEHCTVALSKYEAEYAEPIYHPTTRNHSNGKIESFRLLRRSCATLLIVPSNLVVQWQDEISKHTHSKSLDVLVLDSTAKDIPDWKELMQYDCVLITKARFDQEYRDDDLHQGKRFKGQEKYRSPLTEVRWLRVICDEGHAFAGSSYKTKTIAMLNKLSIERRWVVSGTPSRSLHGVEVGLATIDDKSHQPKEARRKSRKELIETTLESRKAKVSSDEDLKDLERLRAIVVNFLKLQPWANQKGMDHADWKIYLHPSQAAISRQCSPVIRTILQSLIVRHRIEDIDSDLVLPPLHNTTTYLEPSYHDRISQNLFRMVLASNAVTSERTDEDYMFHPKNRRSLDELITNLRRSSFHWVAFTEHEVSEAVRVSKKYLDEHPDTVSLADMSLLHQAVLNGQSALDDPGWKAFSLYHEVGVYVEDFPDDFATDWALDGELSQPLLLGTKQAREAQQHVLKRLDTVDPAAGLSGAGLRAMHSARSRALDEQKAREKAHPSPNGKSAPAGTTEEPKIKTHTATSSSPTKASKGEEPSKGRKRRNSVTHTVAEADTADPELPPFLAKSMIVGFTSAKLAYLCSRVLALQNAEKIIIFYDTNNIAFWIAEALELLSVKFLIYANTLSVTRRAAYLATFNQTETFRVLLMDLKQASQGLHIAAATRYSLSLQSGNPTSKLKQSSEHIGLDRLNLSTWRHSC